MENPSNSENIQLPPMYSDKYAKWSSIRLRLIVVTSMASTLAPLTGSFFLPALPDIIQEFQPTELQIALLVSIYTLVVGTAKILWAPLCEQYSRKWTLMVALILYVILIYFDGWPRTIWSLIILRSLVAFPASSFLVVVGGILSDTFSPLTRDIASALKNLPVLVASIFGATFGGLLIYYWGWRSTTSFLALYSTFITLCVLFFVPETLEKKLENPAAQANEGGNGSPSHQLLPSQQNQHQHSSEGFFKSIWQPIWVILRYPCLFFVTLTQSISMSSLFLLVLTMPLVLPYQYGLNPLELGASLIPFGLGSTLGALLGGRVNSRFGEYWGQGGRLLATVLATLSTAGFVLLFGATLESGVWYPLVWSGFAGMARAAGGPAALSFCLEEQPALSQPISSGHSAYQFFLIFIVLTIGPYLNSTYVPYGWFLIVLSAVMALSLVPTAIVMIIRVGVRRDEYAQIV